MFCTKCGEHAVQDAKFCSKCGFSLVSSPTALQPVTPPLSEFILNSSQVRPWVRYWARMFDIYSFCLVAGVILAIFAPQFLEKQNEYALGMILFFTWVFVESLLLSSFQTTPGKWLLKIKIACTSGSSISFSQALTRSLKVWWRGLGAGFPIVTLITLLNAHGQLISNGITSWDKDESFMVTHKKIGAPRLLAAVAFFIVFLISIVIGRNADA